MSKARARERIRNLIAVGVVALAAGAAGGWVWMDAERAKREEAEAARDTPVLPTGRLRHLYTGVKEAYWLALDEVKPAENGTSALVLTVAKSPAGLEGGYALRTRRFTIDCDRARLFEGRIGDFTYEGKLGAVTTGYGGKHGRPAEASDRYAEAICQSAPAGGYVVTGFQAAQREFQQLPENYYAAVAKAQPQNAHAWAWLCAAAARGAWRPTALADCDRAVELSPKDAAVRLDRAFLNLIVGRNDAADADFRHVIAEQPDNAAALFGHSYHQAIVGDEAESRAYRIRALDADEAIPDRITANYRFPIPPQYRQR